jgi:CheY-like chemotaxis protein
MDGPTATRAIRALGVDWLVFGVTGNGLDSDQKTFLDAGVESVIIKPLYLADFEKAMVSHLVGDGVGMKTPQTVGN